MTAKRSHGRKAKPKARTPLVPSGGDMPPKSLEELAAEQGVKPIEDMARLVAEFRDVWPDDQEIGEFVEWLNRGRRQGWYD